MEKVLWPEKEKAVRLIEYLQEVISLRSKVVRNLGDYEKILWLSDVPKERGCFTQAWGNNEEFDPDIWLEIQIGREPELPELPKECKGWEDRFSLRDKKNGPRLSSSRTKEIENPDWRKDNLEDIPKYIIEYLEDFPEVRKAFERYIDRKWLPWKREHDAWERVHKIYSDLFSIHQEQLRLGEEYELVLGVGLLTWETPSGQRVCRHLMVAGAVLEFEAGLGKFTVRPHPDEADLRIELDMLDPNEQPLNAEKNLKGALSACGTPWNKPNVDGILKALAHSISSYGEYYDVVERRNIVPSGKPIVEYAPALILRKRSAKGLTETLERIRDLLREDEEIPLGFLDICEIRTKEEASFSGGDGEGSLPEEIFFPKPANEEQLRIAKKLCNSNGVLVQGPPGTGKSHTIANLICHLLATGHRVLVTAKTPRALQVLRELIPEEVRPLCVSLLGHGREEQNMLSFSVGGILRKNEEWDDENARRQQGKLERRLFDLRSEKAKITGKLRSIRESETRSVSVPGTAYRGTATHIVKTVLRDEEKYKWFKDRVKYGVSCPFSSEELLMRLGELRRFTPEVRKEMNMFWPEMPFAVEEFSELIREEKQGREQSRNLMDKIDEDLADVLMRRNPSLIETLIREIAALSEERKRQEASAYSWVSKAIREILLDGAAPWRKRLEATRKAIASLKPLLQKTEGITVVLPNSVDIKLLYTDAVTLREHLKRGGKLGWGIFRPKVVKERIYLLRDLRVNGRLCSTARDFSLLCDYLHVRIRFRDTWKLWAGLVENIPEPYELQLAELESLCNALEKALSVDDFVENCRSTMRKTGIREPCWTDEHQVEKFVNTCRFVLARHREKLATERIRKAETEILAVSARKRAHPVAKKLLNAICNRNVTEFSETSEEIRELAEKRRRLSELDAWLKKLSASLPKLAEELEKTYSERFWDERFRRFKEAWEWAQARYWVEEFVEEDNTAVLSRQVKQLEDKINETMAELVSLRAWAYCFSRLEENHRRHMEAWRQAMRRLGKGTGKYAPRRRREARHHLNQCKEGVPAWVMPLHRVWDTVDPAPGIFDVVIVDEASQCGLEALPLFFLGKKILIVGDDKQISPEAVGFDREDVNRLIEKHLSDFRFNQSFDVESSLFDHGKLRYGTRQITLREHFRCMPEIIRFSNDLCYADTPLIPLRQYGPDRLDPLRHVFVENGYREGSHSRAINRPEAERIADTIEALCSDEAYADKTMGVIVLQGNAQARLIENMLLERLDPAEIQRRRLICGNPYSFQGDERDVIFLSMVAAPNERIGPLSKPADERRFNVAVSRARDQVWLFYSARLEDLSEKDLRRKLLEFFLYSKPRRIAGIDKDALERKAKEDDRIGLNPPRPFESWFEVDVALELLRKGYDVKPQFEFAGKRIDLVVEGGHARLAVECDGEYWHGPERYEEDMRRQRQLERCGWVFFRVRESVFYADKKKALRPLWRMLEERGIFPLPGVPSSAAAS